MNALRLSARLLFALACVLVGACVWLRENAREARQKKKLGAAYEGPLEN